MPRRAGAMVGVMGDTGGRTGDAERAECGECARELCDWEFGDVSTVRAGMLGFLLGGIFLEVGAVEI